jgi:hypothetical protein
MASTETSTNPPKVGNGMFTFPYIDAVSRLNNYAYHRRLFKGNHFDAFKIWVDDPELSRQLQQMRYITANFPGLITKISADLLFIEHPKINANGGDQEFVDAVMGENKMRMQDYESALSNSYNGDALYKLRIGPRQQNQDSTIIIERVPPRIYFPTFDNDNILGDPKSQELAWVITIANEFYLRKEIHTAGLITNELWKLKGTMQTGFTLVSKEDIAALLPGTLPVEDTRIDESLLIYIPNWRDGESWNGESDYYDLDTLFFAINNRISKIDNILDKHSDPILMVPPGVLDDKGRVKKKALGVIEYEEGVDGKPEYIVWDASLENAFKQIDRLIDFTLMFSETAPGAIGLDKGGVADSGRALKFKLIRTIAKVQRKQIYYRQGLIDVLYRAQLLAKAWGVKVDGISLSGKPVKPEIVWQDGLPMDMTEQVDIETKRVDAGLTSKKDSIMRLDDIDEDAAQEVLDEIKEEDKLALPTPNVTKNINNFTPPDGNNNKPPVKMMVNN